MSWYSLAFVACASTAGAERPLRLREGVAGPEMVRVRHGFQFDAFDLDRTEVTVGAFLACVDAGACTDPRVELELRQRPDTSSCNADDPRREHHPMNCVSAHDAVAYCAWKGKRLPTHLEWQWAALGRDYDNTYPWGRRRPSCAYAIIGAGCGTNHTWPVGSKPRGASRDGALDLAGNVAEWTTSCVMRTGFAVLGGDYQDARSSARLTTEELATADGASTSPGIGFRCARTAR